MTDVLSLLGFVCCRGSRHSTGTHTTGALLDDRVLSLFLHTCTLSYLISQRFLCSNISQSLPISQLTGFQHDGFLCISLGLYGLCESG